MYNSPSGKVNCTELGCPASPPYPVSEGIIDNCCPDQGKNEVCTEFDSFCKTRRNNCHRYRGEYELEYHIQQARNSCAEWTRLHTHVVQAQILEVTNKTANIGTECE